MWSRILMTDINTNTFEAICKKYNLLYGYAFSTSSYYIGFADLDYHNIIGFVSASGGYLYKFIHLKHDKIIGEKDKRVYFSTIEDMEVHLNELIKQKKEILVGIKERKMKKDFK
jgi:hypothetical protein